MLSREILRLAFKPGDHICALYSTRGELVDAVVPFLAEGLRKGERCWYEGRYDQNPLFDPHVLDRLA